MDRLAGSLVPDNCCLTLIGDADAGEISPCNPGSFQCGAATREGGVPDLLGIMFDPAIVRKVLGKFLLSNAQLIAAGVKNQCAAASGALVDCENICAHAGSL